MKSRVEGEKSKHVIPKTNVQLPILAGPRKDRVEPELMKSRGEAEDPGQDIPKADRNRSKHASDCNNDIKPGVAWSSINKDRSEVEQP